MNLYQQKNLFINNYMYYLFKSYIYILSVDINLNKNQTNIIFGKF